MGDSDPNEFNWLHAAVKRLMKGEAAAMITETQAVLKQEPGRFEYQLTLSMIHTWLGAGNEAEPAARQALEAIQKRGKAEKGRYWFPRYLDLAYLSVFDSLMLQGRFKEAGRMLQGYAAKSVQTNLMWAYVTLAYFMDGNRAAASKAMKSRIEYNSYSGDDYSYERIEVSPKLRLMLGYLDLELQPRGPLRLILLSSLRRRSKQWLEELAMWDDEVRRNSHNPYGVRLAEVVEDLRTMIFKNKTWRRPK